nr:hypothetical protein [Tanacetum cinerariifolium]
MVECKEDEESYASEFTYSVFNDDEDDSSTRIELERYKENPKNINDHDDENDKEKKDEKKDNDGKKDDADDKDNDDHIDHILGKVCEILDKINNLAPEMTVTKTNEMIKEAVPRLVNLAVTRDREIAPINVPGFFIIAVQTLGSGIFILLAVGIPSTGSGNLYCQWELSPGSLRKKYRLNLKNDMPSRDK